VTLERPENLTERIVRHRAKPVLGRVVARVLPIFGIEIPRNVVVGRGLHLGHGAFGLVVHFTTVIGDDVRLYQGVTLGRGDQYNRGGREALGGRIEIGDRAIISAGAVVLFRSGQTVRIGRDSIVGANAVVTQSVPDGEIWAGNPARFLRKNVVTPDGPAVQREERRDGR
jgi:serine O-acetyltransferase